MQLINPNVIIHRGQVRDEDLKARLVREALEQAGWLGEDGKALKGVTTKITREGRNGTGRWVVELTRDLDKSDQPRLTGPTAK